MKTSVTTKLSLSLIFYHKNDNNLMTYEGNNEIPLVQINLTCKLTNSDRNDIFLSIIYSL